MHRINSVLLLYTAPIILKAIHSFRAFVVRVKKSKQGLAGGELCLAGGVRSIANMMNGHSLIESNYMLCAQTKLKRCIIPAAASLGAVCASVWGRPLSGKVLSNYLVGVRTVPVQSDFHSNPSPEDQPVFRCVV